MSALGRTSALDPSDVRQDLGTPLTSSTARISPQGGGFVCYIYLDRYPLTWVVEQSTSPTTNEPPAHRADNTRHYQRPSAQVVLAASHRAYYINRTSGLEYRRPRHSIPYLPPLPHEIHRLQQKRLPVSKVLYQDALAGEDMIISNPALQRWMAKPPFAMDLDETDPYSAEYQHWTECMEDIIDGLRMRLQLEDDRRRRLELNTNGWVVFMNALREEVVQLLKDWESLNVRLYHSYHASRQYRMHQKYLRWLARTIYHLYYLEFLE
ncbi:hypothetical protein B0H14DRAFT_2646525 [Mycena olivaceomarginata]|nr:hypothetical protein B0H14DRAFT_2646525 [Mycena olivaceomarginata]